MPEQAPEAQPEQAPQPQSREHAPIVTAGIKAKEVATNLHNQALETAGNVDSVMRDVLRMDDPGDASREPGLKGLAKTPFKMAGDMLDGSVLNGARRGLEVVESAAPALRGAYRSVKNPIFHPIDTLMHPIQYLANPLRIVTSAVKTAKNAIGAVPNFLDDAANRLIKRPLQRVPLVGGLLGKVGEFTSWITGGIRNAYKWCTDWIDNVDDAVASHQ